MHILLCYPAAQSHIAERIQEDLAKLPRLTLHTRSDPAKMDLLLVIWDGSPEPLPVILAAQEAFKQILPLLVEDAELPESLIGSHAINLSQNPEAGLRKLVAEMRNRLGIPDGVTAPLARDRMAEKMDFLDASEEAPPAPVPWLWIGAGIALAALIFVLIILA